MSEWSGLSGRSENTAGTVDFAGDDLALVASACKSMRKLGLDEYERLEDLFATLTPGTYALVVKAGSDA